MIIPKLKRATMDFVFKQFDIIGHTPELVELWERVGLCIHRYKENEYQFTWRISHFSSGRYVLKNMKTRSEAIQYMIRLNREVLLDWTISREVFIAKESKELIKEKVLKIQSEIDNRIKHEVKMA